MTVNGTSCDDRNRELRGPQSEGMSARKDIARCENEGGSLAAVDTDDLRASVLADNTGWRANRLRPMGSSSLSLWRWRDGEKCADPKSVN